MGQLYSKISQTDWQSAADPPDRDSIRNALLQRIAIGVEAMGKNVAQLERERDYYKRNLEEKRIQNRQLAHRITGLRGTITRMKRQRGEG